MTAAVGGRPTTTLLPPAASAPTVPTWKPGADDLVDAAALLVLSALALLGLQSVYDGIGAMLIGLFGAAGGIVAAWFSSARRFSPIITMLVMLGALLVCSGPAVSDTSLGFVLPGPGTPAALVAGLANSWSDLITTAPPVGVGNGLGVVPYVLGFGAGGLGMLLARRTGQPLLPVAPALVAVGAGLALGTIEPVSVLVQGIGFALVALGWGATRANRSRRSADGIIYWPRIAAGGAMLVGVLLIGALFGPMLPFGEKDKRYVAREVAVPPFDPQAYPSPLAGYRSYRTKDAKEATYFTVDGLPEDARIRLATMDNYNGVVWVVSNSSSVGSGRFERVGQRILPVPDGTPATVEVTVVDYSGVWVPSVGATRSVEFNGSNAVDLANAFRYNRTTGTGATPVPLVEGDVFTVNATLPSTASPEELQQATVDRSANVPASEGLPDEDAALQAIRDVAFREVGKGGAPYAQAQKLADFLRTTGAFSDGGPEAQGASRVPAGHSIARLSQFLTSDQPVGNAEQYASAMALMAREVGLPARVVLGFNPDKNGKVTLRGADADAWVEVAFEGYGWIPFDPVPDEDKTPEEQVRKKPLEEELAQQESPPPAYLDPPKDELDEQSQKAAESAEDESSIGSGLPRFVVVALTFGGPPLALIILMLGTILGLKHIRGRRRRKQGSAVDRVQGAWLEMTDRLRDLGHRPATGVTRREYVAAVSPEQWPSALVFANQVDQAMFGPDEPDAPAAETVWQQADHEFAVLAKPLTRRQKLKASFSLASLRPRRR